VAHGISDPRTVDPDCRGFPLSAMLVFDAAGRYQLGYESADGDQITATVEIVAGDRNSPVHLKW